MTAAIVCQVCFQKVEYDYQPHLNAYGFSCRNDIRKFRSVWQKVFDSLKGVDSRGSGSNS
jgi:hypothetical protein